MNGLSRYQPDVGMMVAVSAAESIMHDCGKGVPPDQRDEAFGYFVATVEAALQSYLFCVTLRPATGLPEPSLN
ncbi:MAG: hypothetical protein ACRC7O_02665 [Fimbriiglobus sp.]